MDRSKRIPIPISRRWQRFRYQALPVLSFAVAVVGVLALWQRQGRMPNGLGEVEAVRIDVKAAADGQLVALAEPQWTLFEQVQPGQVLARLDDAPARKALATLQKELARLEKDVAAEATRTLLADADRRHEQLREATRLAWQIEQYRIGVLDRQAQIETDRVELARLNALVDSFGPMIKRGYVSDLSVVTERLRRDAIARKIAENATALEEARRQGREAVARLAAFPAATRAEVETLLAPLRAAIETQEARIGELAVQIEALEVRAPIGGVVSAVHLWPGQAVRAGEPIVTLAADNGRYIVSYVRAEQRIRPSVGMEVEVRLRDPGSPRLTALVERIGPQIEPVPPHQLRDVNTPEWGLPVRIGLPREMSARPGELIDIRFPRSAAAEG